MCTYIPCTLSPSELFTLNIAVIIINNPESNAGDALYKPQSKILMC